MPKQTLWIIGGAFVLLGIFLFRAGTQPARVVVLNQSGHAIRDLVVGSTTVGTLGNGESRVVHAYSGDALIITFQGQQKRRWQSPETMRAGGVVYIVIKPGDRVLQQRRILP